MEAKDSLKVVILSLSNYITVLVNTVLFPIFPAMSAALDIGLRELAWMVGIVSFPAALVNLLAGILSDSFGRKLVVVVSLFLYGIGGLLAGLSILIVENPFPLILAGRLVQGIGAATPMFLSVALVSDLLSDEKRNQALGFLEAANGLGKVSSPLLGAVIGLLAWHAIFFLYPLVAFPVAIFTWLYIEETQKEKKGIDWERQKKAFFLFKNPSRIISLMVAFFTIFVIIGTMFWLSDYLEDKLEMGQVLRGLVISLPAMAMVLTALGAGKIGKSANPRITITLGILVMTGGSFLLPAVLGSSIFWFALLLVGIGAGVTLPVVDAISTSISDEAIRGELATIYGAVRSLGGALSTIIISMLLEISVFATFWVIGMGGIVIGLVVFFLFQEKKIFPPELLPED